MVEEPARKPRRRAGLAIAWAAALVLVLAGGAIAIYRAGPTAGGSSNPSTPMASMTVSQALMAIAGDDLTATDLFRVEGWLQSARPPIACPTVVAESAFGIGCGADRLVISERSDGTASLAVFVLPGTLVPAAVAVRGDRTAEIVVVGHVRDARASFCAEPSRTACGSAFVLDQVASFDGQSFGPSISLLNAGVQPSMTAEQVRETVGKVLQPDSTIVSMTAATLVDAFESYSPGLAPSGDGAAVEWYVKVLGPPATLFPMPGSRPGSGVLVLEEKSQFSPGGLRGMAGWGWDPRMPGVAMSDGTISLATTNWLPGSMCAGVGTDAVLRGSRDDPRIAWLEYNYASWFSPDPSYKQPTIVWPAGYRARFTPNLEVMDGDGQVVLRDGDRIQGACGNNPDTNTMYLEPPFS